MTPLSGSIKSLAWLIHKDLVRELRTFRVLPGVVLLGIVLVTLLALQFDLPMDDKQRLAGGLMWLAILFAGTLMMEPAFANERENGCWEALTLYPIAPSVLFLAKMTVNLVAIAVLEILLIPIFVAMTDVPLFAHPSPLILITGLSNIGLAAVGTVIGAVTVELRGRSGLVAVLLFPLLIPVVLAAASATSLMLAGDLDQDWWRWIQLLALFAALFTIAGALVFEFIIEES